MKNNFVNFCMSSLSKWLTGSGYVALDSGCRPTSTIEWQSPTISCSIHPKNLFFFDELWRKKDTLWGTFIFIYFLLPLSAICLSCCHCQDWQSRACVSLKCHENMPREWKDAGKIKKLGKAASLPVCQSVCAGVPCWSEFHSRLYLSLIRNSETSKKLITKSLILKHSVVASPTPQQQKKKLLWTDFNKMGAARLHNGEWRRHGSN